MTDSIRVLGQRQADLSQLLSAMSGSGSGASCPDQRGVEYLPPMGGGGGTWSGKGYQLQSGHCGALAVATRDG